MSDNPKTMKAWVYTSAAGGVEKNLKLVSDASAPFPEALPKDVVLVKVHSSSLNPVDYKLPELGLLSRLIVCTPASPGLDFAGVVAAVGSAVTGYSAGDKVFGRIEPNKYGTLGEYVPAKAEGIALVPEGVSLEDASTIGTAGLTAFQCIVPNVKAGDKVFINGGSGGTGSFGIQFAKAVGCHVTTSCSAKNEELVRKLGADEVIDYTKENVSEALKAKGQVFKLAVDNIGSTPADLYKAADHYLLPEGKFMQVTVEMSLGGVANVTSRQLRPSFLGGGKRKLEFYITKNSHKDLEQIAKWFEEGKVKAVIDEVFQHEDAPKAFEKLKTGRVKGKVVIRGSA
ncbi:reticulon-4-interacting protein 1, mitochondrial precursor [Annulohypoxylon maeteangense]|uniref:reticulon-4-interacting protein 1, mitochondrial precursor n=1 Tax=Annulohypoxylon maeteangense TaxID=1927788 RepID=UPI002007C519|nr:reticulon-4-interacting protein 1, mitochondrial precursor [Annulohypoxylon maeteangense]KAI0879821.1 reticulon-4-interacting protein 1, mitochondrial precursor [Annulohypoxylon maeteangense]